MKRYSACMSVLILFCAVLNLSAQNFPGAKVTSGDIRRLKNNSRNEICADIENKIFLIDKKLLFHVRIGKCSDNSYAYTLYGRGLKKLCYKKDSIIGPDSKCDTRFEKQFEKLIANVKKENLGLKKEIQVEKIM